MSERILIVEDEQDVVEYFQTVLEGAGFVVVGAASTSVDAAELARTGRPHLALVDVRLADAIDGITLGRHLFDSYGIRIVFVSGSLDDAVQQGRDFAAGFIGKPCSPADLAETVTRALEGKAPRQ